MFTKLRNRAQEEKGFTLIELLVVILIIGILAAIALPAFLGQRSKGQDSNAKSDARNVVSEIESCFTEGETYVGCETVAIEDAGLVEGTGPGEVAVTGAGTKGYTVTAYSKSGNEFQIVKDTTTGRSTRPCTNAETKGGCGADLLW